MILYLMLILELYFSQKLINIFQLGPLCFFVTESSKGLSCFHVTDLLRIKWKSEEGYEMSFRKNIRLHSIHFQVKIKKSLVALLVTGMKRLRCAGQPQSYFCSLTALLLRLLSVTHPWKEGLSVFIQQFADSLMWLQVPPLDFHRYRWF